jgi:hypothetical protein
MKNLLLILTFLSLHLTLLAQDTLIMRNGDEIPAKVLEISPTEVVYKKYDNLEGPIVIVYKSAVFMIKYQNGTKDVFAEETPRDIEPVNPLVRKPVDMYLKGRQDAKLYYKGNGALFGTLGTSLVHPAIGLATGVVISAIPPEPKILHITDQALMHNPDYIKGYRKQAQLKKIGKSATGFGIAVGVYTVLVIAILSSM